MEIDQLIRPNILKLKPYSSARNEFSGNASIFIDANENPYNNGYNRYPDPLQRQLKKEISKIKKVSEDQIFLGNGSDEAIDLIYRIFCNPGQDNVIAPDPTYGMYQVCAEINDIKYNSIPSNEDFSLPLENIINTIDNHTKVIFLCSPNNPSGNLLNKESVKTILNTFQGIVVIDEAYIDFASKPSYTNLLNSYPNLIILQTFSKAWGQASIRLGMAFASKEIINYFNKVKYPYNVNLLTQQQALEALKYPEVVDKQVNEIKKERELLRKELTLIPIVKKIFPSEANFLLVKMSDGNKAYHHLSNDGIIVRNRNKITLCGDCLRITVGTPNENKALVESLKSLDV